MPESLSAFFDRVVPIWYYDECLELNITFMPPMPGKYYLVELKQRERVLYKLAGINLENTIEQCIARYEAKYSKPR